MSQSKNAAALLQVHGESVRLQRLLIERLLGGQAEAPVLTEVLASEPPVWMSVRRVHCALYGRSQTIHCLALKRIARMLVDTTANRWIGLAHQFGHDLVGNALFTSKLPESCRSP